MEQARLTVAAEVVESLLNALEAGSEPISQSLLKAKRVARLLRDGHAQIWLDFEMKGYPNLFEIAQIGYCVKYLKPSRFTPEGRYRTVGLPAIEAEIRTLQQQMSAIRYPSSISTGSASANSGPSQLSDAAILASNINQALDSLRDALVEDVGIFEALKAGIHSYATDCQISLQFGDVCLSIFEKARGAVDNFVRSTSPKAAEQLLAAYERLAAGESEARAQCLTSCRRVLLTVADAVFPAQTVDYQDRNGRTRKVGAEEYKNRLLAFLDQHVPSEGSLAVTGSEIGHLAARLDAVHEKTCKGVHADISQIEAELAVIHTYLFLAEVARVRPSISAH